MSRPVITDFYVIILNTHITKGSEMLNIFTKITEELHQLIKDDPVRPEIPLEHRVNDFSKIYMLKEEDGKPTAVVCVKFLPNIPESVDELFMTANGASTAVFYTIWSYAAGAGKRLLEEATKSIKETNPEVDTFVTLSPKTEMARRFHHKNGATTYRENTDSVNYLYQQGQAKTEEEKA
jgi:hypothetical protein